MDVPNLKSNQVFVGAKLSAYAFDYAVGAIIMTLIWTFICKKRINIKKKKDGRPSKRLCHYFSLLHIAVRLPVQYILLERRPLRLRVCVLVSASRYVISILL